MVYYYSGKCVLGKVYSAAIVVSSAVTIASAVEVQRTARMCVEPTLASV